MLNDRMKILAEQQTQKLVLKGKTIKYNNRIIGGQFNDSSLFSYWGIFNSDTSVGALTFSNGIAKITYTGLADADYRQALQYPMSWHVGQKFFCSFKIRMSKSSRAICELNGDRLFVSEVLSPNEWHTCSFVATIENQYSGNNLFYPSEWSVFGSGETMEITDVMLVLLSVLDIDYIENLNEFYATDLGKAIKNGYYPPFTNTNKLVSLTSPFTFKREIEYNNLAYVSSFSNSQVDERVNDNFNFAIYDYANHYFLGGYTIEANGEKAYIFTCDITSNNVFFYHSGTSININFLENISLISGHKYIILFNVISRDSRVVGGLNLKNIALIDLTQLGLDRINSVADFYKTELGQEIKKGVYLPYSVENRAVGLPKEYQEVEYIESGNDANQYINSLVKAKNIGYIEFYGNLGNISDEWKLDGIGDTPSNKYIGKNRNNKLAYGLDGDKSTSVDYTTSNKKYVVDYINGKFKVDDVVIASFTPIANDYELDFAIFAGNSNGYFLYRQVNAKKYYYIIKDLNGNVIRHLIPCYRKADNVVGMYDLVNGQFYTNQGTGAFTKGKDVGLTIYTRTKRVDLGTLNWETQSGLGYYYNTSLNSIIKRPSTNNDKIFMNCGELPVRTRNEIVEQGLSGIAVSTTGALAVKEIPTTSTILEYETAEPLELNGINNDRVVDLGRLTWSLVDEHYFVSDAISEIKLVSGSETFNGKCQRYEPITLNDLSASTNKRIALQDNGRLWVRDSRYTNATDFKNSLNGIMLTYETDRESLCDTFTNTSGKVKRKYFKLKINDATMDYANAKFRMPIENIKSWNDDSKPSPYILLEGYEVKNATDFATSDKCINQIGTIVVIKDSRYTSVAQFKSAVGEQKVMYLHYRPSGITETERSVLVDHRYNKIVDANGIEIDF